MSDIKALPADGFNGSPLVPTGNPMIDGVGPAAWADRADQPDRTFHGAPKIVPMRLDPTFSVAKGDPDPRGLPVEAVDKVIAGTVIELWVDRAEPQVRYYEVQLSGTERRIMGTPSISRESPIRFPPVSTCCGRRLPMRARSRRTSSIAGWWRCIS